MNFNAHLRFSFRWAFTHFVLCLLVAALSAFVVFGVWYPEPWRQMLGVIGIFGLVVVVDVVCGPLLTLLLASPHKSRNTLIWDLAVVALLQVAALGYGVWTVFAARPVAVVFEVDRLVVVTANEVLIEQLNQAPVELQKLPWTGARYLGVRTPETAEEHLQSVELSLSGVTTAMRPGWWRPFAEAKPGIQKAAKPLQELIQRRPEQRTRIDEAVVRSGYQVNELRFLPLTSSRTMEWVALLAEGEKIVGFAQVDGFE